MVATSKRISERTNEYRIALMKEIAASNTDDCILWPYGSMRVYNGKSFSVAAYICTSRNGERPSIYTAIERTCGDQKCVNPRHLAWMTNTRANAMMRTCDAEAIRDLRRKGLFVCEIASKLNVSVEEVQKKMDMYRMRYL